MAGSRSNLKSFVTGYLLFVIADQPRTYQLSIVWSVLRERALVERDAIDEGGRVLDFCRLQNLRPVDARAGHLDAAECQMRQQRPIGKLHGSAGEPPRNLR